MVSRQIPSHSKSNRAADAAYQRFLTKLTTLPPWSIWEDDACDGPIHIRITKEVASDHFERNVFQALKGGGWALSIALAEALLADAEARLNTLDLQQYSPTVAGRMVKAFSCLAERLRKQLAQPREG